MLSDVMEGVLMDVVTGTLVITLSVLAGTVMVMTVGMTEGLIKLLTDVIVGVTLMVGYAVMDDVMVGCSLAWDVMAGETVIGVTLIALADLLMVSGNLACVVTRLVCNKYNFRS